MTAGVTRADIARRTRAVLSRGGRGNPEVRLVEGEAGPVVVKDFAAKGSLVRRFVGPWLLRREVRAYRRLGDVASVPRWLGWIDRQAIALEYRPGTLLSRSLADRLPEGFVDRVAREVAELHRRGVVHLDLRHRSNVLASEAGDPVLLDFASAMVFDPRSWLGRLGLAMLTPIDRRALSKWRARLP